MPSSATMSAKCHKRNSAALERHTGLAKYEEIRLCHARVRLSGRDVGSAGGKEGIPGERGSPSAL